MSRASVRNAVAFRWVLEVYCVASSQKVNLLNLAIYFSPKTNTQVRQLLREILNIIEQSRAIYYLRVPISRRCIRRANYNELEALINTHLEGWKSKALSMMGRATFVKLIFNAILIYLLSYTVVSRATLSRLE